MNADAATDYQARVDKLIDKFFGDGNPVWQDRDPNSDRGRRLTPYLQVLRDGTEVPIVLPRQNPQTRQWVAYVIPRDRRHAAAVAELLQAFVGPSHARFNGLPAALSANDPIDKAALDFAGHPLIFVLASPRGTPEKRMWDALRLMQQAVAARPHRSWHAPVPLGRLLAQFDLALAAGANTTSAAILEQLAASGGINAANLCHLRVKRLARLGRHGELLRLADLADVALTHPPTPVRDAILSAVFSTALAEPLAAGDLQTARTRLIEVGTLVPALIDGPLADLSPQALTTLALAAWVSDTTPLTELLRRDPRFLAAVEDLAPDLAAEYRTSSNEQAEQQPAAVDYQASPPMPHSWLQLIASLDTQQDVRSVLDEESWRAWAPAAETDGKVAEALERLDDEAASRAWEFVGAFVDSDRYLTPAARTAREFLTNALTHDRFSPGDLAGIVALTEIVLRSSPDAYTYRQLVDDLASEVTRWAGPDRATTVLDLVDLIARAPCPDSEGRLRLAFLLLRPLADHPTRLDTDQLAFAVRLSSELEVALQWPQQANEAAAGRGLVDVEPQELLLYSLDERVLERVTAELRAQAPQVNVTTSHDYVGSRQLKQWVRRADVVILATRCATHAATGFIRANCRPETIVREADGSGSASLLRAATVAITRRRGSA